MTFGTGAVQYVAGPPGTWTHQYERGKAVRLFAWFGHDSQFPEPGASQEVFHDFAEAVLVAPAVMILLGVVAALAVFLSLCCCPGRSPGRPAKPSSKPMLCSALLTFLLIWAGAAVCWATGGRGLNTAEAQLSHARADFDSAASSGASLNQTGTSILESLDKLLGDCPPDVATKIEPILQPFRQDITSYVAEIQSYLNIIKPFQPKLAQAQAHSQDWGAAVAVALSLPLALVTVSCMLIAFAVLVARGIGASACARCTDFCLLRLGSVCVAFAVLLAALVAASEAALGVATSSFCYNVDANVVSYTENVFGSNSTEFQATKYYVTEQKPNPLVDDLNKGFAHVAQANASFLQLEQKYGNVVKAQCKGWTGDNITEGLKTVDKELHACLGILSPTNIYPFYQAMVHQDVCGTVIEGLGWLVLAQLLAGLLCLPVLGLLARSFIARWVAWKESDEARALLGQGLEVRGRQIA